MQHEGLHFHNGKHIIIETNDGLITSVSEGDGADGLPHIGPPLLDMQVNGYMGRDINNPAETAPQDLADITRIFTELGIAFWVPTLITNNQDSLLTLLGNIKNAIETIPEAARAIPGIHIEGPYISAEDGPRGAHDARFVRPPSIEEYQQWQEACGNRIKIITLAPEHPGTIDFIKTVINDNVVVSIGHCNADRDAIKAAVDAGASLATHLGNGAHPMVPRHYSYIWELLAEDRVWAGLIGDGFHLPQAQLQNFIRAKRPEKVVLTSDTVHLGGMQPGEYALGDLPVRMLEDGKIVLAENDAIMAGASFHLLYSIENAVKMAGVSQAEAWIMASENAARMMHLPDYPCLREGDPAVFNLMRWDDADNLNIEQLVDERG